MNYLSNSNMTYKRCDCIWEVTASREVTNNSWFWKFIWDIIVRFCPALVWIFFIALFLEVSSGSFPQIVIIHSCILIMKYKHLRDNS